MWCRNFYSIRIWYVIIWIYSQRENVNESEWQFALNFTAFTLNTLVLSENRYIGMFSFKKVMFRHCTHTFNPHTVPGMCL